MSLTDRQRRGLRLAAQGYTVEEIAHRLRVHPMTVKRDRRAAMAELDAPTVAVAIVKYLGWRSHRRAPEQPDTLELV